MQSVSTLQAAHAALQKHLQHALIKKGGSGSKGVVTKLLNCPEYRLKYDNLHARLHAKGERCTDGSTDPQDNTAESTYNREEWLKLNLAWLAKGTPAGKFELLRFVASCVRARCSTQRRPAPSSPPPVC